MKKAFLAIPLSAVMFVATCAAPTYAQQRNMCADRALVLDRLQGNFGETRQVMGINGQGHILEVHGSEETGTWTITITRPDGQTCLVAAGGAFEDLNEELEPAGDDT